VRAQHRVLEEREHRGGWHGSGGDHASQFSRPDKTSTPLQGLFAARQRKPSGEALQGHRLPSRDPSGWPRCSDDIPTHPATHGAVLTDMPSCRHSKEADPARTCGRASRCWSLTLIGRRLRLRQRHASFGTVALRLGKCLARHPVQSLQSPLLEVRGEDRVALEDAYVRLLGVGPVLEGLTGGAE